MNIYNGTTMNNSQKITFALKLLAQINDAMKPVITIAAGRSSELIKPVIDELRDINVEFLKEIASLIKDKN